MMHEYHLPILHFTVIGTAAGFYQDRIV